MCVYVCGGGGRLTSKGEEESRNSEGEQGEEGRVLHFLTWLVAFAVQFECPLRTSDHCLAHSWKMRWRRKVRRRRRRKVCVWVHSGV